MIIKSVIDVFALAASLPSCFSKPNIFHFDYGPGAQFQGPNLPEPNLRGPPIGSDDGLFEGDMRLTEDQLSALKHGSLEPRGDLGRVKADPSWAANGIIGNQYRWPSNTLKFDFDPELSEKEKSLVRSTLQNLQEKLNSCVRFVESKEGNRILVKNGPRGCHSAVGYRGGIQEIYLQSSGCMKARTIEHEFLHAVGIYHTQSRSDRDDYVKILWDNIPEDSKHQFNKYTPDVIDHFNLPYDYESVMHYGSNYFGINQAMTIQTLDPNKQRVIGSANGVSPGDIALVKKMYSCDENTNSKRGFMLTGGQQIPYPYPYLGLGGYGPWF